MTAHPETRPSLTRDRVLETALRLADEGGIGSLSMRRLARELGVEAMSLYNHVANKGDLVDGIVDLAVREIELPPDDQPWEEAVRLYAVRAHDVFARHPWACSLVMAPSSTRNYRTARLRALEWLLRRLREAGFSAELAYHAYHTLDAHILGFTMWQHGHSAGIREASEGGNFADLATRFISEIRGEFPYMAEHAELHIAAPKGDADREFVFGLDLILDGLKRTLAAC